MSFLANYFSSSSSAPAPPQLSRQSSLSSMPSIPAVPSTLTRSVSTSSNTSSFEFIDNKQLQSPASTPHGQWFADAPPTPSTLSRQGSSTSSKSKKSFAQILADSNRQFSSSSSFSQTSPQTPSTPFSMVDVQQYASVPPSPFQLSRNASFEHVSYADVEPEFTSPPVMEEQANEEGGYSDEEEEERCFHRYSGYNESLHDIRVATKHKSNISFEYEGSLVSGSKLFKVRHRPLSNFELPQYHYNGPAAVDGAMNFYQTKSGSAHRLQQVALGMRDGPHRAQDAARYKQDALPSPFVQDQNNVKRGKPSSSSNRPRSNVSHDADDESVEASHSTRSAWFEVHAQRQQKIKREKAKREDKALVMAAAQREAVHAHRPVAPLSEQKKQSKDYRNRGYHGRPLPFGAVNSNIDLLSPASLKSLDTFRVAFYRYYAQLIQHAFGSDDAVRYFGRKVTGIRICPLSSNVSEPFLKRLRSTPYKINDFTTPLRDWYSIAHDPKTSHLQSITQLPEVTLSFHGSTLFAMESIIQKGFIAPSKSNGITPHGNKRWWHSEYTGYVYSSLTAQDASNYASNSSTLFVCASIPLTWQEKLDVKFDEYLLSDQLAMPTGANGACADRMIPLFLLDFEVLPRFGMGGSMRRKNNSQDVPCGTDSRHTSTKRQEQGPQINTSWVRKELRKKHTLAHQEALRQHAHQVATSGASMNLVEMDNLPDQYCTPDEDDRPEHWREEIDEDDSMRSPFAAAGENFATEESPAVKTLRQELDALMR